MQKMCATSSECVILNLDKLNVKCSTKDFNYSNHIHVCIHLSQ